MNPKTKLPRFELKINPDADAIVSAVSLVDQPAIESNFQFFTKTIKEYKPEQFSANDEKQELMGAAMIPSIDILRVNQKTGEQYNVFFTPDTIRQIAQQYSKSGFQNNMNIEHSAIPAHSYIFQSFITDKKRGINAPTGIDVPDGSWIVGVKVDNADVWNDIKAGKVKGFSIEGVFQYLESNFSMINNNEEDKIDITMTKQEYERFTNYLKLSNEGKTYSDDQLKISDRVIGGKVEMVNADGSLSQIEDGSFCMTDGFCFSTRQGLIDNIEGQEAMAKKAEAPISGDTAVSASTAPDAVTTDPTDDDAAEDSDLADRVTQLEGIVSQLVQALTMSKTNEAKLSSQIKEAKEAHSKEVGELNEKFGKLIKTPVQASKTSIQVNKNEKLNDSIKIMAESLKKK